MPALPALCNHALCERGRCSSLFPVVEGMQKYGFAVFLHSFNPWKNQICVFPRFPSNCPIMSNKRFGCLAIGLFLLLCLSAFLNLILIAVNAGGVKQVRKRTVAPQFEERVVVNGSSSSKIALISLRGIISSSISGSLGESMVDDLKSPRAGGR